MGVVKGGVARGVGAPFPTLPLRRALRRVPSFSFPQRGKGGGRRPRGTRAPSGARPLSVSPRGGEAGGEGAHEGTPLREGIDSRFRGNDGYPVGSARVSNGVRGYALTRT